MATPTDPTAVLLCTEAYKQAGILSPTSAQLDRAEDYFLEEILDDIWNSAESHGDTRLKTLQSTNYFTVAVGRIAYTLPEFMDEEFSVTLMDGDSRGTAQAGAATTITLAADEDISESRILGKLIYITGGTGTGGSKRCVAYNSTTKVATVDSAWTTNPASGSTYMVVERATLLDEENDLQINDTHPPAVGKPSAFAKYAREIVFDRPMDQTYVFQLKSYYNIHQVDRDEGASLIFTRILRNWRSVLQSGLEWKILESEGDANAEKAEARYERRKARLIVREIPYGGEFKGFTVRQR